MGGGGGYSYICVLPDEFLLKSVVITVDFKINLSGRTRIYEYAPPPPPINALVTALKPWTFFNAHRFTETKYHEYMFCKETIYFNFNSANFTSNDWSANGFMFLGFIISLTLTIYAVPFKTCVTATIISVSCINTRCVHVTVLRSINTFVNI